MCIRDRISYSLAARTMALDIRTLTWSREICDAAGIDPAKFSTPVPSGTIVGPVKEELANELGLPLDTRAVSYTHLSAESTKSGSKMSLPKRTSL